MFFHDVNPKTRTTFKISTLLEDLSFVNPRSHLKNFRENTCVGVLLNKVATLKACNTGVFHSNFLSF